MKKLVNEWLKAALLDLKNIEKIINDEFLTPMVAFHAHQAIEKSLKAIIGATANQDSKDSQITNINRFNRYRLE